MDKFYEFLECKNFYYPENFIEKPESKNSKLLHEQCNENELILSISRQHFRIFILFPGDAF